MFWVALLLLVIAIFLILLEVVAPFGISFFGSVILIGLATYLMWQHDPEKGLFFLIIAAPLAAFMAYWVFRRGIDWMTLGPPKPDPEIQVKSVPEEERPNKGETVKVVQPLHPTGTVIWNKRRLAARTLRPEIESKIGEMVVVRGMDSIYLLVEPSGETEQTQKA